MDLLELQQRANVLVDKVNQYEENLTGLELDENQVINEHKYVDIFCLRPVLKLLFGKDISEKTSRTTVNDIDFNLISSSAPANNTTISFFENTYSTVEHPFVQNIDMWNNYNMTQLDIQQLKEMTRQEAIEKGIGLSYSSNIKDALVTESQVANLFNWNTTSDILTKNNTYTFNRQVPGLVLYYLGNGYDGVYTATIPYNPVSANINYVNFNNPPLYGAYYDNTDITKSQVGLEMGAECCRVFLPGCNFFGGRLLSPQQIWQPDKRVGEANANLGYNYQGKALYHELVFKQRRTGCQDADVDFTEALSAVPDNDPQGLATRLALSRQKEYYFNRPWFKELNSYASNLDSSSNLANKIIENSYINVSTGYALADFLSFNNNSIIDTTTGNFDFPTNSTTDYVTFNSVELLNGTYNFIISFILDDTYTYRKILQTSAYCVQISSNRIEIRDKSNSRICEISASSNTTYTLKLHVENNASLTIYNLVNSKFTQIGTTTGDMSITSATLGFNGSSVMYGDILGASSYIESNNTKYYLAVEQFEQQLMTDDEFYNSYKLDYNTFADALDLPK